MKKLSFILALVLILSTFTFPTFAEAATNEAKIGDVEYATLAAAITSAAEGDEIVLLKDVTYTGSYTFQNISVTINGNNKTLTTSVSSGLGPFYVKSGKTVTFKNLTVNATFTSSTIWGFTFVNGGHVVLENCKISADGSAALGVYGLNGSGTITLKNTVTVSNFGIYYYGATASAGTITVSDGEGTQSSLTAPALSNVTNITEITGLTFNKNANPFNEAAAASIGTTQYPTLAGAIAAVKEGETVKLLEHVSDGVVITRNNISWTLDGNGKSINSTDSIALDITSTGSNVTVKNLTVIDNHSGTGHGLALRVQNGTVTLDNCKLSTIGSTNTWGATFLNSNGTLKVTNGTEIDGAKNPAIYIFDTTGTCIVYDGTLKTNSIAYNNKGGTCKMYGGKTVIGSTTTSYNPVMLDGASIRTTENSNGIRFTTSISADLLAHIKSLGATKVSYGTVIFKADSYKALGNATPAAAGWTAGTYVDIPANNGFVGDKENGPFVFNAALTNIQDKNLDAKFGAVSYVEYTVGSETFRIYSEYNEENNSRKIKDVALAALKDVANASTNGEYEKDGWEYKYEIAFYYDENGQRVEGKAYSCYTAEQYAVVEEIYNRQPVAN